MLMQVWGHIKVSWFCPAGAGPSRAPWEGRRTHPYPNHLGCPWLCPESFPATPRPQYHHSCQHPCNSRKWGLQKALKNPWAGILTWDIPLGASLWELRAFGHLTLDQHQSEFKEPTRGGALCPLAYKRGWPGHDCMWDLPRLKCSLILFALYDFLLPSLQRILIMWSKCQSPRDSSSCCPSLPGSH